MVHLSAPAVDHLCRQDAQPAASQEEALPLQAGHVKTHTGTVSILCGTPDRHLSRTDARISQNAHRRRLLQKGTQTQRGDITSQRATLLDKVMTLRFESGSIRLQAPLAPDQPAQQESSKAKGILEG